MTTGLVYEISRYDASTDVEVLVERAQLLASDGVLWSRVDGGTLTRCVDIDVAAAIGADPFLSEVRANQVTRVTAEPKALRELPLALRVPGQAEDFDASQWSTAMREVHWLDSPERGACRVLLVNEQRWGAWTTTDGERMLPEDDDDPWRPRLTPPWAHMTWMNAASRTSGYDHSFIGLVTPGVVAFATQLDEGDGALIEVIPRRQGDAVVFVTWLLQGGLQYLGGAGDANDDGEDLLLAQLFAEASTSRTEVGFSGSELAAGTVPEDLMSVGFEWTLELNLDPVMIGSVLDQLAQRGPRYLAIVTATRDPGSPAGRARRAAVDRWEQQHPEWV